MILEAVKALKDHKVMIIGDLMLDHYLIGGVERISPEAPVPVVQVSEESYLWAVPETWPATLLIWGENRCLSEL
jgi:hypothetical protein